MVLHAPWTEDDVTDPDHLPLPDAAPVDADLLSLIQAAHVLRQPVEDVFRAVMCGRLPVVWIGPRPYVDRGRLSPNHRDAR